MGLANLISRWRRSNFWYHMPEFSEGINPGEEACLKANHLAGQVPCLKVVFVHLLVHGFSLASSSTVSSCHRLPFQPVLSIIGVLHLEHGT